MLLLKDYIEAENNRLEAEQQFWSREIVVRIEYKHCPNLTIIDTPGMKESVIPHLFISACCPIMMASPHASHHISPK